MKVKNLKKLLEKMPEDWQVFMNCESELHPDFDEPCNDAWQDLDAKVIILRS